MSDAPTQDAPAKTPSKKGLVIGAVLALVIAGIAAFFLSDSAEEAVSIDNARENIAAGVEGNEAAAPAAAPDSYAGSWTVQEGNPDDINSGTFAGYRVTEVLQSIGEKEATGRSPGVTGSVNVQEDGTVSAGEFVVDMTQLTSDSDRRDGALSRFGLEYGDFPTATFTFDGGATVDLAALEAGTTQTVDIAGSLMLHGVAKDYTIPMTIEQAGANVLVVGSQEIVMSDHDITPPKVGPVLEIEDTGVLEVQLLFTPDAA